VLWLPSNQTANVVIYSLRQRNNVRLPFAAGRQLERWLELYAVSVSAESVGVRQQ
jgi:hypothetical protein